jgi:transmembrane sensor
MKAKSLPSKVNRLILEEASEWFVDFRVGDVDQDSRTRFDEWLRRSPEHIRAYMEIAKTYVELPALAGQLDVDALINYAYSGENVVPFENAGIALPGGLEIAAAGLKPPSAQSSRALRRAPRRFLSAAACALFLVIAGAVWWQTLHFPTYATDVGERRSLTLADGSTVDLNARSKLRVEFNKQERRVSLLAGQALFQVAKDKKRAFIVASGDATVRAVGTQFDVYRRESGTTVTVLEGRVAVYSTAAIEAATQGSASTLKGAGPLASRSSSSGSAPAQLYAPASLADPSRSAAVFLSAGEQVTVTPAQVLPAPAHADIATATAWIQRRLIFDGSRLSDVVQEFNRYNRRQIAIEGIELSDFHVSGVYSSTDPASLIRFLREQPGVKITETADEVRIESN